MLFILSASIYSIRYKGVQAIERQFPNLCIYFVNYRVVARKTEAKTIGKK